MMKQTYVAFMAVLALTTPTMPVLANNTNTANTTSITTMTKSTEAMNTTTVGKPVYIVKDGYGQVKTYSNGFSLDSQSADKAILSVEAIGFVDTDGSKLQAIAVQYDRPITANAVSNDTYEIEDYGMTLSPKDLTYGINPGVIKGVYTNDEPTTIKSGIKKDGNYVIIEVNTDYQAGRFARAYPITMFAGVKQIKPVETVTGDIITPSTVEKTNYTKDAYISYNPQTGENREPEYYNFANTGTYSIKGLEGYELHTTEKGNAFHASHAFDEGNGEYWDFDLNYALYVPKDYNPAKKYGLLLHIHDAGSMSSDPMLTLTESQAAANYASPEFQQMAKDQGLAGVIVVAPAIPEFFYMDEAHPRYELRLARDNWTLSAGVPAIWQLMDSITSQYSIDTNRIYGSGQSMGGMTVMAMAAQRDNYFAGLLPMSAKWGNNYNKDYEFNGNRAYETLADGTIIWTKDSDGKPADYRNWFYMVSDDNILYFNTIGENTEFVNLYHDLAGVTIPRVTLELGDSSLLVSQDESIRTLTKQKQKTGTYQVVLGGNVSHMSAWFYGHGFHSAYEWLLKQTRDTEMKRSKLKLNRPFQMGTKQIHDDIHLFKEDKNDASKSIYYPTGKRGTGTSDYNSPVTVLGSKELLAPNWKP